MYFFCTYNDKLKESVMNDNMRIIGLTGGIGTGKSTAAEYLKTNGFAHIDADQIGRNLTADGSSLLPLLDSIFGPDGEYGDGTTAILRADGSLDRKALASIVFTDMRKKLKLDEVMFKAIIAEVDIQLEAFRQSVKDAGGETGKANCILIDAPLLFEAGLDEKCDEVLLIVADMNTRIHRVCARDGATAQEVRNRINSQMTDEEMRARADIIVDNSGDRQQLENQLKQVFSL